MMAITGIRMAIVRRILVLVLRARRWLRIVIVGLFFGGEFFVVFFEVEKEGWRGDGDATLDSSGAYRRKDGNGMG